jgi:hypothetical protein
MLSPRVLTALGHRPDDRPDVLVNEERSLVWKLAGVKDIVALKNGQHSSFFPPGLCQETPFYELHRPMRQYAH